MRNFKFEAVWPILGMFALFMAAICFRPLLPIDETRYMSVAWEMWLRGDWLAPLTLNFELYSHKPPLLFWLINDAWSIFGVSRWAGLVPIILASIGCVYLTQILAQKLFKKENLNFKSLPFIMMGSVPFLIYNTLVMFDVILSLFVLSAMIVLVLYARNRRLIYIPLMAIALGLGVLTKGPVAWLYVIFPVLLAPLWIQKREGWLSWYGGCVLAFLLSTIPVLMWLIPVLNSSNPDFAFWLVWEQTAGRITGGMENAHTRPIYFYLPLLPVLFLPWAFFPSFWTGYKKFQTGFKGSEGLRFIACWVLPVIIAFSFIGGKQPHYLVPLLPGILIAITYAMPMSFDKVAKISVTMLALFIFGQGVASYSLFDKYDLQPVADYVSQNKHVDWGFVRKYQGELTFLGRLKKPLDSRDINQLEEWFNQHPDGVAVVRYATPDQIEAYEMLVTMPYRSKNMGVFKK